MRYFWTFFWTFVLVQMLNYVVTSMTATAFDFKDGSILAVIAAILILMVSLVIPNDPIEHHGAHE